MKAINTKTFNKWGLHFLIIAYAAFAMYSSLGLSKKPIAEQFLTMGIATLCFWLIPLLAINKGLIYYLLEKRAKDYSFYVSLMIAIFFIFSHKKVFLWLLGN